MLPDLSATRPFCVGATKPFMAPEPLGGISRVAQLEKIVLFG